MELERFKELCHKAAVVMRAQTRWDKELAAQFHEAIEKIQPPPEPVSTHTRAMWEYRARQAADYLISHGMWGDKVAADFLEWAIKSGPTYDESQPVPNYTRVDEATDRDGGAVYVKLPVNVDDHTRRAFEGAGFTLQEEPKPLLSIPLPPMRDGDIVSITYDTEGRNIRVHKSHD